MPQTKNKKKLIHYVSINIKVKSDEDEKPTKEEIQESLNKYLESDPIFEHIEVYDSEDNNEED